MSQVYDEWWLLERLGGGGQGEVHLAIRLADFDTQIEQLQEAFENISPDKSQYNGVGESQQHYHNHADFADALRRTLAPNMDCDVVALKILNDKTAKSLQRAEVCLNALRKVEHASLVQVKKANLEKGWIAYRYYPGGALGDSLKRFKAKPGAAIEALFPVAQAVSELHKESIIHRDIKPQNVFIDSIGGLVLGDCDLVYDFEDEGTRITSTNENVGTRRWMPPWLVFKDRVPAEEITAACDVYALARLLWTMIAGEDTLEGYFFERDEHNLLSKIGTRSTRIPLIHVNDFLRKYLCDQEAKVANPRGFVGELNKLRHRLSAEERRKCMICELGRYFGQGLSKDRSGSLNCHHCGHTIVIKNKLPHWIEVLVRDGKLSDPGMNPFTNPPTSPMD